MAPHIGSMEILVLALLALTVLGPRDLPLLMHRIGRWSAAARAMANEFKMGLEEIGREAEVQELQDQINSVTTDARRAFDEIGDMANLKDAPDDRTGDLFAEESPQSAEPTKAEESPKPTVTDRPRTEPTQE